MATYTPLDRPSVPDRRFKSHRRSRTYRFWLPTDALDRLQTFVETKLDGLWVVRELRDDPRRDLTEVEATYGPVHGNFPSDVRSKLLGPVDLEPIGYVESDRPVHVDDGSCHHYNCASARRG